MLTKLTEQEKQFAEKNHGLVENYLKLRGLPFDEYYDTVIFGYLNAVQKYLTHEELRVFSFRTIAFQQMRDALIAEGRWQCKKKRAASVSAVGSRLYQLRKRIRAEYATPETLAA